MKVKGRERGEAGNAFVSGTDERETPSKARVAAAATTARGGEVVGERDGQAEERRVSQAKHR